MENLKKCVKSGFPYKLYHLYFSHRDFSYTCVCASMCEMFENLGLIYLVLLGRHYLVNRVRSHFEIQWEKIKYWLKNWWADEELVSSSWTSWVDLTRFTHEISPVVEGLLQRLEYHIYKCGKSRIREKPLSSVSSRVKCPRKASKYCRDLPFCGVCSLKPTVVMCLEIELER